MKITYWTSFSKRKNSTKQPSGGTEVVVTLKQGTTIETPTFILTDANAFNIVYVSAFGHYYFVSDIKFVHNNTFEVACNQDVLATYKTNIGATSAYILYDTDANFEIPDDRLSVETTPQVNTTGVAFRSDYSAAGTFIVTLTGTEGVGTYAVPESTLSRLMPDITTVYDSYIQSSDPFGAIVAAGKQLVGSGSLAQNIRDVRWIPFTVTTGGVNTLKVGMYTVYSDGGVPLGGRLITNRLVTLTADAPIPWRWTGVDWRNSDPYTQISMYIPYVGTVSYPTSVLKGATYIHVESCLDTFTGDLAIRTYANGATIGTYGAQTGVIIPLGSAGLNPSGVVNSVIGAAASVASGSALGVVSSAINACQPLSQSVGGISNASGAGLNQNIQVTAVTHAPVETPSGISAPLGTPSCQVKTISSLSGYVQCQGASVSISGPDMDRDEINSFLNSGFYYE